MRKKRTAKVAPDLLKSPEEIIGYLTPIIKAGDTREFETASAVALQALKLISEYRQLEKAPDWFLKEWMELRGISQVRIRQLTGWSVGKVNEVYHGQSQYRRSTVNTLASILDIEPYELLMHPAQSRWMRQLIDAARSLPERFEAQ